MPWVNYKILVVLITAALIGVIAIQSVLFSGAMEARQARFRSEAMHALHNAGDRLELLETMGSLGSEFQPWLSDQLPKVFDLDSTRRARSLDISYGSSRIWDSLGYYTFRVQQDTTYYDTEGQTRVEVLTEGMGQRMSDGKKRTQSAQIRRIEERVMRMDTVLQTFVRSSVRNYRPIEKRFTVREVDSVLNDELSRNGIETPHQFALSEGDYLTSLKSDGFVRGAETWRIPIFRNDLLGRPIFLLAQFPDREHYVYRSMWQLISLSILFTTGVVFTFWKTLQYTFRLKKVSSIKSDFINNMTHEFKTPLATINLAIDALNSPKLIDNPERRMHYTDIIRRENLRLHNQVEHVLRMSLLDKDEIDLQKEPVQLHELLEEAIKHVQLKVIEAKGEIRIMSSDGSVPDVNVDRHQFTTAILNILDNAIKYSEGAPEITITIQEAVGRSAKPEVELSISDRGIGMTPQVVEHVFDRFYRAQKGNVHNVKGHGLGLAYAKEIVEMHNGRILVESQPGIGSTFRIIIPAHRDSEPKQ